MRVRIVLALAAAFVIPACDNSGSGGGVAAFTAPAPFAVELSAAGHDQLQSVVANPAGGWYAAGFSAADTNAATPKVLTVVKFTAAGGLDLSFGGGDGIASITEVACVGTSDEIDIALQPDAANPPKIIVSTTVLAETPNATDADDRDVAVVRLNANGTLDATFATTASVTDGVRVLNLAESIDGAAGGVNIVGRDGVRGLAVDPANGLIYLHAYQRAEGLIPDTANPREDTDFTLVRLTAGGDLDSPAFAGDGKHLLDLGMRDATPRSLTVLADGSVIAAGYANSMVPGWTTTVQPVVYKLSSAGLLVAAFADGGVWHQTVLETQTEAYGFSVHGANLVTAGYGRESGSRNDWISLRFNSTTGARDLDWGGASNGAVVFNPSPFADPAVGSNCRGSTALSNGKTLLFGSTGRGPGGASPPPDSREQRAVFGVLSADGALDPAYGGRTHNYELGLNGNDQFWGAAQSGDFVLVVGWQGGAGTLPAATDDESFAVLVPVR